LNNNEKVFYLWVQGVAPGKIAERVGISKQRVHQILGASPAGAPRKPGLKPRPLDHLKQGDPPPPHFDRARVPDVLAVLDGREEWTPLEADRELQSLGLKPPIADIYRFLRKLGFGKPPGKKIWTRK